MSAVLAANDAARTELEHGTYRCYQRERCRCVLCRAANAAYHRAYMARNPEQRAKVTDRRRQQRTRISKSIPPWPGLGKIVPRKHKLLTTREMTAARARVEEILADAA